VTKWDWSEADLRGIDLRKLRKESFDSPEHQKMMKAHYERVRILKLEEAFRREETNRPKKPTVIKPKPVRLVTKRKAYTFTEDQVRVALSAMKNKENN
jgi:hypothetical protein